MATKMVVGIKNCWLQQPVNQGKPHDETRACIRDVPSWRRSLAFSSSASFSFCLGIFSLARLRFSCFFHSSFANRWSSADSLLYEGLLYQA